MRSVVVCNLSKVYVVQDDVCTIFISYIKIRVLNWHFPNNSSFTRVMRFFMPILFLHSAIIRIRSLGYGTRTLGIFNSSYDPISRYIYWNFYLYLNLVQVKIKKYPITYSSFVILLPPYCVLHANSYRSNKRKT